MKTNDARSSETRLRAQQAKEFLISQVVDEAKRENVPLSEIERKMLYFTESYDPPPDIMEINDEFERDYDSAEYEKKIAGLLRNARVRNRKESPEAAARWKQAVADISMEDHYIMLMLGHRPKSSSASFRQLPLDIAIGLALVTVLTLAASVRSPGAFEHRVIAWLLGWMSNNPFDRWVERYFLIFGALALWLVYGLGRRGGLGEFAKTIWNETFGGFLRARQKIPPRE
ncbi:MAG: hypothetical protein ACLP1Y_03480 [Candidatus Acidiferrales bacterium]